LSTAETPYNSNRLPPNAKLVVNQRAAARSKETLRNRCTKRRYNGYFAKGGAKMLLGAVTYNVLKDWDLETILKNLEAAGFEAVELRTGHKHGVEISLDAA